jgi:hypothetical protein
VSRESDRQKHQDLLDADFRAVLTSPAGRRVIAFLVCDCGLYSIHPDLGKRSVALVLRDKAIMLDPKIWSAIEAEILARRVESPKPPVEVEDD